MAETRFTKCPYGKKETEIGYTPRAMKFHSWMRDKRATVEGIQQKKGYSKIAIIGDYVWFPYPHWNLASTIPEKYQSGAFTTNTFIEKDDFTVKLFQTIVRAIPQAVFGGAIQRYQIEIVPTMVQHVKEELPEFYNDWAIAYPDTAEKFKDVSSVGREARLDTIKAGTMVEVKKDVCGLWDGKQITVENYQPFFMGIVEKAKLVITPKKDAVITITNDNQVTNETVFVD